MFRIRGVNKLVLADIDSHMADPRLIRTFKENQIAWNQVLILDRNALLKLLRGRPWQHESPLLCHELGKAGAVDPAPRRSAESIANAAESKGRSGKVLAASGVTVRLRLRRGLNGFTGFFDPLRLAESGA